MDWNRVYQEKVMSAQEAIDLCVKDGDRVAIGGTAIAKLPLNALLDKVKAGKLKHITLNGNILIDDMPFDDPELNRDMIRYECFFFGGVERRGYAQHNVTFVPMQFNNLRRYMVEQFKPNVGIIQLSAPNEDGFCCISPACCGFNPSVVESADCLIAQVNKKLPWLNGHPEIYVHLN